MPLPTFLNLLFLIIYAAVCAWEDLRHRQISLCFSLLFGIAGAILCHLGERALQDFLLSLLPGLILLAISLATDGCIGIGDAVFVLVCACYLSFSEILYVSLSSLWLGGIMALVLAASAMIIRGGRKKSFASPVSRSLMKSGIPYVAVMCLPIAFLVFRKMLHTGSL